LFILLLHIHFFFLFYSFERGYEKRFWWLVIFNNKFLKREKKGQGWGVWSCLLGGCYCSIFFFFAMGSSVFVMFLLFFLKKSPRGKPPRNSPFIQWSRLG
jgi:hypothetical protein